MNLYEETEQALTEEGYNWDDIAYIGSEDIAITVDNFKEVAKITEYDNGFGAAKVAQDIIIIMKDNCWYKREEYDGSEWWEFYRPIEIPEAPVIHMDRLVSYGIGWELLAEIYTHKYEEIEKRYQEKYAAFEFEGEER